MSHVKSQPKCTRKINNDSGAHIDAEVRSSSNERRDINLAMFTLLSGNSVENSNSISTVSLLLGEECEAKEFLSDDDFFNVPGTFRTNLSKALRPILGRSRKKGISKADQLELDAKELLKFAESIRKADGHSALAPYQVFQSTKKRPKARVQSKLNHAAT